MSGVTVHEEILKDIRTEAYRSGYHDGLESDGNGDIDWICVKFFEWISYENQFAIDLCL